MKQLSELEKQVNDLIVYGGPLEAFELFYDDDVVMQENTSEATKGKEENRRREKRFYNGVSEVRANLLASAVADDVALSEWAYDILEERRSMEDNRDSRPPLEKRKDRARALLPREFSRSVEAEGVGLFVVASIKSKKATGSGIGRTTNPRSEVEDRCTPLSTTILGKPMIRPEWLLPQVRAGISSFANPEGEEEVLEGCRRLEQDIRSGRIEEVIVRYADVTSAGDYVFVAAERD